MSDPRATSRGSKTAAVVMLVVFIQVLIVAILGLGAIGRDRQLARDSARSGNRRTAIRELRSLLDRARREIVLALNDVRELRSYADLELLRADRFHGRHADLIRMVYQVDPENGVIYSLDGIHRHFVPPEVLRVKLERAKQADEAAVAATYERTFELIPKGNRAARIEKGLEYFRRYPYRQDSDTGYPKALAGVGRLIQVAEEEAALSPRSERPKAYQRLEEVLLAALEITALNKDRAASLPEGDLPKLETVPKSVQAAVGGLLREQRSTRLRVETFRRARQLLEGTEEEPALQPALDVILSQPPEKLTGEDVIRVPPRLLGIVPWVPIPPPVDAKRHLLVLLSQNAARHLVEELASDADLERLGLALDLRPSGDLTMEALAAEDVAAHQDLLQASGIRLPYTAALRWVKEPPLPAGGPGEFFYWGIIALSAAGLIAGGWVLMRIYTREVRLARLKADFVSNLSHELKTPLTSIAMWTEMLQDERMTGEEDRQEALGVLAQESDRLQGIVRRMLDTAKREARGATYHLEPGDLNEVVGRSAERFRRIVTEPGLDLISHLDPEPVPVLMDAAAIDDLVSNLISNAWKYKQGDAARIMIRTARRGRKAELTVADDGLGIPRQERRKVFEMFYRADAYLTRAAGTGLGLSLVRTIVKAHKGSIRIETGLNGRGTLFRIRLPLRRGGQAASPADSGSLGTMSPNPEAQLTP